MDPTQILTLESILYSAIGSLLASAVIFLVNALYWRDQNKKKFYHALEASEPFSYNGDTLRIYGISLENLGRDIIEEIECHLSVSNGEIADQQCKADRAVVNEFKDNNLIWKVNYLNSGREIRGLVVVKEYQSDGSSINMNAFGRNIHSKIKPEPEHRNAWMRITGGFLLGVGITLLTIYIIYS